MKTWKSKAEAYFCKPEEYADMITDLNDKYPFQVSPYPIVLLDGRMMIVVWTTVEANDGLSPEDSLFKEKKRWWWP